MLQNLCCFGYHYHWLLLGYHDIPVLNITCTFHSLPYLNVRTSFSIICAIAIPKLMQPICSKSFAVFFSEFDKVTIHSRVSNLYPLCSGLRRTQIKLLYLIDISIIIEMSLTQWMISLHITLYFESYILSINVVINDFIVDGFTLATRISNFLQNFSNNLILDCNKVYCS